MTFLIGWGVLLLLFFLMAVYRGYRNKLRLRKLNGQMKSIIIKVNELWQRVE